MFLNRYSLWQSWTWAHGLPMLRIKMTRQTLWRLPLPSMLLTQAMLLCQTSSDGNVLLFGMRIFQVFMVIQFYAFTVFIKVGSGQRTKVVLPPASFAALFAQMFSLLFRNCKSGCRRGGWRKLPIDASRIEGTSRAKKHQGYYVETALLY